MKIQPQLEKLAKEIDYIFINNGCEPYIDEIQQIRRVIQKAYNFGFEDGENWRLESIQTDELVEE